MDNKVNLKIILSYEGINGKFMSAEFNHDGLCQQLIPMNGRAVITTSIELPDSVYLNFFGKDQDQDTVVGPNGEILQDVHIKIEEIILNNMPIKPVCFPHFLKLHTEDGRDIRSAYIGFNGSMQIDFNQKTFFQQLMWFRNLVRG